MKKFAILVILAVLSIKCQDTTFLDTEKSKAFDFNEEMKIMLAQNVKSSLEIYTKYSDAFLRFTNTEHLRNLRTCDDWCVLIPRGLDCGCTKHTDCCSNSCRNLLCAPA